MSKGFLEDMDSVENDGPYHKNRQLKMIKPSNGKDENLKLMNGFACLQSMNQVGNIKKFEEYLSLKLNSNVEINTSLIFVPCSTRSNMQGYSILEHENTPHSWSLN